MLFQTPTQLRIPGIRASIISNLELIEISALCTKDSAVAIIKHRGGKYLLVSQYMDINLDVRGDHVDKILNYAAGMNIPLLMGADTNSHTILFGPDSNRRGLVLCIFSIFFLMHWATGGCGVIHRLELYCI